MKKQYIFRSILLTILTALILIGCEDVVELNLDPEEIDLVSVEAYLTTRPANNIYVKLERTQQVDRSEANPPVRNANVRIADDQGNAVQLMEQNRSGIYLLPDGVRYQAFPGRTYTLTIMLEDGTVITASDYLAPVETLDKIKVNLSARGNYEFLAIFINSQETPGLGNYYKWDIFVNDSLLNQSAYLAFASDELVDGNYIYDFEIFTDFYSDEEDRVLDKGDLVRVEQLSISKTVYDFYFGMVNQAFTGSPFSVPPANLPNNLSSSDGSRVVGIFSARDVSSAAAVKIDDSNFQPLVSSAGS